MITVAVVDNHDSVREGVVRALKNHQDRFRCVGHHADVESLVEAGDLPEVVVLDLYLGRDDAVSTPFVPDLVAGGTRVVLFTAEETPVPLRAAVAAGVAGLSLKNDGMAALLDVVSRVAEGDFVCSSILANALVTDDHMAAKLTEREVAVLANLDDGLTQRQVARRLGISHETVRTHLKSVRAKYLDLRRGVTNTSSIVREARREGWLR